MAGLNGADLLTSLQRAEAVGWRDIRLYPFASDIKALLIINAL